MNILYIPLDERPCNYFYPQMMMEGIREIKLITPPGSLLGSKKHPADIEALWYWLYDNVRGCQYAVLSVEMLVYGGLLPSRIHYKDLDECLNNICRIKKIKEIVPEIKIFVSNLVMRTPSYSSSEEEPDYYELYGKSIFEYGWYLDKKDRGILDKSEEEALEKILEGIPEEVISDYRTRRRVNLEVNKSVVSMVKTNYIDFLVIPQDDCSQYGFSVMDQKQLVAMLEQNRLQSKIHVYPGADEVGCTLISRAYTEYLGKVPGVYVVYSSTLGPSVIPLCEDRPLNESVKSHIIACGAILADTAEEADFCLFVNCPGDKMQESLFQDSRDITYSNFRNLREFVQRIKKFITDGKKCVIADTAFINGGDTELIQMLDDQGMLDKLMGYAGWNTACNTLGTAISHGIMALHLENKNLHTRNIIYRLIEDWCYQSHVRQEIIREVLPGIGASKNDLKGQDELIHSDICRRLHEYWNSQIKNSFGECKVVINNVYSPWRRMFEIGMDIIIQNLA